jgi:hypothetical protein
MLKDELKNIISRIGKIEPSNLIETIACYLRASKTASSIFEKTKFTKQEEEQKLIHLINQNNFWLNDINFNNFFAEGAEQKVYLNEDGKSVLKTNDSIFYEYWLDYFNSLLLHNYFFPQTTYTLLGFTIINNNLFAVIQQPFIVISEETNLEQVKKFLLGNGFTLKKNNDYFNEELGIILEDLHDENVLTNNGVLFFIDTVFYIKDKFYK